MTWLRRLFTRQAPLESSQSYSNLRWPSVPSSPNQSWINDPLTRGRAEQEVRNSALAKKIVSAWSGAVIGGNGVSPMFQDALLRQRWTNWSRSCDATARTDWIGLQLQVVELLVTSGEAFCLLQVDESPAEVPLSLNILGPEFVDASRDNGRDTVGGIRYSGVRPEGYWLFRMHPGTPGADLNSVFIPATECIHIYRPARPGAQRGESWLSPVLYLLRLLKEYLEADLVRSKTQSLLCGFVRNDGGAANLTTQNGSLALEPASIIQLPMGADITFSQPTDHGSSFAPFVTSILHQIAAGVNLPYELLTTDLSQVNFAAGRAGLLEFRRQVESIQFGLLVPAFEKILRRWLELAAALGYTDGVVMPPRWSAPNVEMLDRRQETETVIREIRAGLRSRSETLAAYGWNAEDVDKEIAADQARADELGLALDVDARKLTQQGQAQPTPTEMEIAKETQG